MCAGYLFHSTRFYRQTFAATHLSRFRFILHRMGVFSSSLKIFVDTVASQRLFIKASSWVTARLALTSLVNKNWAVLRMSVDSSKLRTTAWNHWPWFLVDCPWLRGFWAPVLAGKLALNTFIFSGHIFQLLQTKLSPPSINSSVWLTVSPWEVTSLGCTPCPHFLCLWRNSTVMSYSVLSLLTFLTVALLWAGGYCDECSVW